MWPKTFFTALFTRCHTGRRQKLLAVLFLKENAFLLIDEPTNHLDVEARETVGRYLDSKKGFILVSHDRTLLNSCTSHTLAVNKTNIEVQKGNFASWFENKRRQDEYEISENEKLKKDIRRLTESSRQAGQWADHVEATKIGKKSRVYEKCIDSRAYIGEKSRRMQQRRKNLEKRQDLAIEDKKKLLKNIEEVGELRLMPERYHGETLSVFRNVSLGYGDGEQYREAAGGLSFSIMQGDRIVLEGHNGCGKSSVLKLLLKTADQGGKKQAVLDGKRHEVLRYSGVITASAGLKISYVPQSADFLSGTLQEFASDWGLDEPLFLAVLRKLDFSRVQFEKRMEDYSEGQKKKVLLAKSLCEKAHLYIWDEPLNYIDIFTRMQLEDLILKYAPTMIFVEHDRAFAERAATGHIKL